MVSLSRNINTSPGAIFLDNSQNPEDRRQLTPTVAIGEYGVFKPLTTISVFTFHTLYTVALELLCIVYAVLHPDEKHKCREYFIIIYVHIGLWFLTLVVDQVARMKHFSLRLNGYLDFYNKTHMYHRLPMYIVSLWTAVIAFIGALMQHFYSDDFAEKCIRGGTLSPINYLCAIISLEFCILMHVNINYIVSVRKFNSLKAPPDVQREEWEACSAPDAFAQGEIGYQQAGASAYDFIEKQADLIRHLKEHNARLGEKLMVLSAQLQTKNRSEPPQ